MTTSNGNLGGANLNTAITSTEIQVKITNPSQSTGTFSFYLNNVINPPSTRSYVVFPSFVIKDSGGNVMSKPSIPSVEV